MSDLLSRRNLLGAGSGVLAGAAILSQGSLARAGVGGASTNEAAVRAWYKLWEERRDWPPFDAMLADDFTFSSTNGEDRISKAEFKQRCWEPNINFTKKVDLELMMAEGDYVFVKYLGHTTSGKTFRNVELLKLRDGRITSLECYFGGKATLQSAMESQKN